jgi:flagellar FliL protein
MSDNQEKKDAAAAPEEGSKKKSSKRLVIIAAVVGVLAGTGAGAFLIGPRFAAVAQSGKGAVAEEAEAGNSGHGASKEGEEAAANIHTVNNVIVNPAGSLGTRFLMVSVGIASPNTKALDQLRKNEVMVRDLVIGVLEKQTMESLAMPGARDSVRAQIAAALAAVAGKNAKLQILLPQFVVQ